LAVAVASEKLERLRALARVMDDAVRIPGTNLRFGLDALIGLIPGMGDTAGGLATAYTVVAAHQMGAPKAVLLRMVWNVLVDTLVGSVPVLGDLFDVGFKANRRNVQLLETFVASPRKTERSSSAFLVLMLALVVGIAGTGIAITFLLVKAVLQALF
jgi:hypothetical protein